MKPGTMYSDMECFLGDISAGEDNIQYKKTHQIANAIPLTPLWSGENSSSCTLSHLCELFAKGLLPHPVNM